MSFKKGDHVHINERFGTLNGSQQTEVDRRVYVGRKARVIGVYPSGDYSIEIRTGMIGSTLWVSPVEITLDREE